MNINKLVRLVLVTVATILLIGTVAYATGDDVEYTLEDYTALLTDEGDGQEHDGYIVSVKSGGIRLFSAESETTGLTLDHMGGTLYQAGSLTEIQTELTPAQIDYIEPNYIFELDGTLEGETVSSMATLDQWHLDYLGASNAWARGLTGDSVRVGIIDSGLLLGHEDMNSSRVVNGWNYIDDNSDVTDKVGHGTMIAGIIGAVRDNDLGVAGIADGATIVPLRAFEENDGKVSNIAAAIYDAVDVYGCRVINMSFSSPAESRTLKEAVEYAYSKGVIMVAAAGNSGGTNSLYPACFDEVIGVGSIGKFGSLSSFSQRNEGVFVTAPGEQIRSISSNGTSAYTSGSGTSFSAPMVAAAAALTISYDSSTTDASFRNLLSSTSKDMGAEGYDTSYGHGVLDLNALSAKLTGQTVNQNQTTTTTTSQSKMTDISGHWAEESINYVVDAGLLTGVEENVFGPEQDMTRAMFVTVLGRLYEYQGGTVSQVDAGFTDVSPTSYYAPYVGWAQQAGIVNGIGNNQFGPNQSISREQAAVIMYNYMQYTGQNIQPTSNASSQYSDINQVSSWATVAMTWALDTGIISGQTSTTLNPGQIITRGEIASILHQYMLLS